MGKLEVSKLKKLIQEVKLEQAYREKFVENFVDVRTPTLTSEELDLMADHLYEMIIKNKS
tara:strand:- start:1733 stop:1912 length:180 start_codon:yes stop_codon:yes gene_type:complete